MGLRLDQAAEFSLVNLVYNIASLLAVFALAWAVFSASLLLRSGTGQREPARP